MEGADFHAIIFLMTTLPSSVCNWHLQHCEPQPKDQKHSPKNHIYTVTKKVPFLVVGKDP